MLSQSIPLQKIIGFPHLTFGFYYFNTRYIIEEVINKKAYLENPTQNDSYQANKESSLKLTAPTTESTQGIPQSCFRPLS